MLAQLKYLASLTGGNGLAIESSDLVVLHLNKLVDPLIQVTAVLLAAHPRSYQALSSSGAIEFLKFAVRYLLLKVFLVGLFLQIIELQQITFFAFIDNLDVVVHEDRHHWSHRLENKQTQLRELVNSLDCQQWLQN